MTSKKSHNQANLKAECFHLFLGVWNPWWNPAVDDIESNTVDENWSYISQKTLEVTKNFIPHEKSKGKRHLPWVSTSVQRLMNKCDWAYKKARHGGKVIHLAKYKRLRNITTNACIVHMTTTSMKLWVA